MNAILESNRAYQFAQLDSALRSGRVDRAKAALAKLRQLGIEVRLVPELTLLASSQCREDAERLLEEEVTS